MDVTEIAHAFNEEKISLLQACRKLDELGYTFQEIRRVIKGAIRAEKIRNGEKLEWKDW